MRLFLPFVAGVGVSLFLLFSLGVHATNPVQYIVVTPTPQGVIRHCQPNEIPRQDEFGFPSCTR